MGIGTNKTVVSVAVNNDNFELVSAANNVAGVTIHSATPVDATFTTTDIYNYYLFEGNGLNNDQRFAFGPRPYNGEFPIHFPAGRAVGGQINNSGVSLVIDYTIY